MRVLVLGANGFIGSAVVAALLRAGIAVRAVVRGPEKFKSRFPSAETLSADLCDDAAGVPGSWKTALDDVDAVVNAAGVLQPRRAVDAFAVHVRAPDALFASCEDGGVRRVIQISAVGVDEGETVFARSKKEGDAGLMERDLDWTVLRPAIVVGDGSYGGTSMLRAIAAFPMVTPVIGDGATPLDVIHKDDLAQGIVRLLQTGTASKAILEPAGPERLDLTAAVQAYRRWLGLPAKAILSVPDGVAKVLARLGDICKLDPINTTSLAQFKTRLTGDAESFAAATGVAPRSLTEILASRPSETQDLWHARLYLLRPVVRLSLALLWLVSGLLGLFAGTGFFISVLNPLISNEFLATAVAIAASLADLAIAAALFAGWRLRMMAMVQFAMVIGYTVILTILAPALWGDPFGVLLKNVPIIALILVHRVLEEER